MNIFRRNKGNYKLISNKISSNKSNQKECKKNDYKCRFEQCEKARIQGRPLPSIPKNSLTDHIYEEPLIQERFTARRMPSENTYELPFVERLTKFGLPATDVTAGGTRRRHHRNHATKSKPKYTHKKRVYGKRTMRKRGKRTMRKRLRKTMRGGD